VPAEPVGLSGSPLALAFTDISQTWPGIFGDRTVLALSASDPNGLPGTGPEDDAMAILRGASEYLAFDPGSAWGESAEIDWDRTRYNSNADAKLFINEIGTEAWRPATSCEGIANLSFAGDFCGGKIGMTTIEAAVMGGVEAAAAIVARRGFGAPIEVLSPRRLPTAVYAWLRAAWAPYAAYAKWWSGAEDLARAGRSRVAGAGAAVGRLFT
jgi:hypothetical protein